MDAMRRYDSLFQYYGNKYGVDWKLLWAQAKAESNFDPDAKSKVGARGLSQFMNATWSEWKDGTPGVQSDVDVDIVLLDPRDPEDAIRAQAAYMSWLSRQFSGDVKLTLAAYNWGVGRMKKLIKEQKSQDFEQLKKFMPIETQNYVTRIVKFIAD